jgi:hypothetical protein
VRLIVVARIHRFDPMFDRMVFLAKSRQSLQRPAVALRPPLLGFRIRPMDVRAPFNDLFRVDKCHVPTVILKAGLLWDYPASDAKRRCKGSGLSSSGPSVSKS